jgi:hypothetical protein
VVRAAGFLNQSELDSMTGTQRKPPSRFYILAAILISIVVWATLGPPAPDARPGSKFHKDIFQARHATSYR